MSVSRVKTWISNETLTASDLNSEFNNILDNGEDLAWPASKAKDFNGQELILDADLDTSITADTDDQIDFRVGGVDVATLTATDFTLLTVGIESRSDRNVQRWGAAASMQARTNLLRSIHQAANHVLESQSLTF